MKEGVGVELRECGGKADGEVVFGAGNGTEDGYLGRVILRSARWVWF